LAVSGRFTFNLSITIKNQKSFTKTDPACSLAGKPSASDLKPTLTPSLIISKVLHES